MIDSYFAEKLIDLDPMQYFCEENETEENVTAKIQFALLFISSKAVKAPRNCPVKSSYVFSTVL
jgi:hypothetical protein